MKTIKIFGIVYLCLGAVFVISAVVSASLLHYMRLNPSVELAQDMPKLKMEGWFFWGSSALALLISLGFFISGIGLLRTKEWARRLIILSGFGYLFNFIINIFLNISMAKEAAQRTLPQFVQFTYRVHIVGFILGLLLASLIALPPIIYFTRTGVKKCFSLG